MMMLIRLMRSQSGSTLISSVFGIAGSLVFALAFANLVRYVGSISAVEQTTQRVSRCLTPSDPQCKAISLADAPHDLKKDWYLDRYENSASEMVGLYNYRASFERQIYAAHYDSYLVHIIKPELRWTSYTVPKKIFSAHLNPYEYLWTKVKACGERHEPYRPVNFHQQAGFEPHFMHFDYRAERAMFKSANYTPYCKAREIGGKKECCLNPQDPSCNTTKALSNPPIMKLDGGAIQPQTLSPFTTRWYESGEIEVPKNVNLDDVVDVACMADGSNSCDSVMQNATGTTNPWWAYSNVAFRIIANVCVPAGKSSSGVAWSDSLETKDEAIQLKVIDNGKESSWMDYGRGVGEIALGGNNWDTYLKGQGSCMWHATYLRGVQGLSYPGSGNKGEQAHPNIFVPWGQKIKLRGLLRAGRSGIVVRDVRFQIYFSSYQDSLSQEKCVTCEQEYQQFPNKPINGPLSLHECSEDEFPSIEGWQWSSRKFKDVNYKSDVTRSVPSCSPSAQAFKASAKNNSISNNSCLIEAAVCSSDWRPSEDLLDKCQINDLPAGRLFCGWNSGIDSGEVLVATVPEGCEANARTYFETMEPAVYRKSNFYGNRVVGRVVEFNQLTSEVNRNQPDGAPRFAHLSGGDVRWISREIPSQSLHPSSPDKKINSMQKWDFSWEPVGTLDDCSSCQASSDNCSVESCLVGNTSEIQSYRRIDNDWRPDISEYNIKAPSFANLVIESAKIPSSEYLATQVTALLTSTTEEKVDYAYPFKNKPEFEIPYWGVNDCNGKCDENSLNGYQTIDSVLRAYVTLNAKPQHRKLAADERIYLKTSSQYVGDTKVEDGKSIAPCTPRKTSVKPVFIGSDFLGRFSTETHPNGPEVCSSEKFPTWQAYNETIDSCEDSQREILATYGGCRFADVDYSLERPNEPTVDADYQVAREIAFEEMKRFDPNVSDDCALKQSNCYELNIDESDPYYTYVKLAYKMPLTFPFNDILGKDVATISHSRKEIREIDMLRR